MSGMSYSYRYRKRQVLSNLNDTNSVIHSSFCEFCDQHNMLGGCSTCHTVSLPVSWADKWALLKQLNWQRCWLGWIHVGPMNNVLDRLQMQRYLWGGACLGFPAIIKKHSAAADALALQCWVFPAIINCPVITAVAVAAVMMAYTPSLHRVHLASVTDLSGHVESVDRGNASVVLKISSRACRLPGLLQLLT